MMLRILTKTRFINPLVPALTRTPARCYAQRVPSNDKADEDGVSNTPIQFFGSKAASWRARDTRSGGSDEVLWYQPYVISGSLAVFLLYFCCLREESDIDRRLEGDLYSQVSGMEEVSLSVNYNYNKKHGLDTKALEKRLTELGVDVRQLDAKMAAN